MKINIIYFSQTGNTKKVAKVMQSTLNDSGHTTQVIPLRKATPADTTKADLIAIGAPCFAAQAPTPIKSFLHSLPNLNGKPAFVFATSGGAPGRVLYDMASILKKKDAKVLGGFLSRGEVFHPAPCMIGRFPGRPDMTDLETAKRFASALSDQLGKGPHVDIAENRQDATKHGWGFYDFMAKISPDPLQRILLPKPKLDENLCNECKLCAVECPMDNIALNSYPKIGGNCIRCYRCITICPKSALWVNWLFPNLVLLSLYNLYFERWFGDLKKGERFY